MAINKELLATLAKNTAQTTVSDSLHNTTHATGKPSGKQKAPSGVRIRKRHWFLSMAIIVGCGWITHTTTATIAVSQDALPSTETETPLAFIKPELVNKEASGTTKTAATDAIDNAAVLPNSSQPVELTTQAAQQKIAQQPELESRPYKIGKGESLGVIFRKMKLDLAIPHYVSKHETAKQLTSIRAGKVLDFRFDDSGTLQQLRYPINALQELRVSLDGNQVVKAEVSDLNYQTKQRSVSGEITSSLYLAAQSAGLSNNLIMEMVRIFGWDIDFVQDIRSGDHFHIVFNEHVHNDKKLADGHILAAEFTTQGQTYRAIRFADDEDGSASYFNTDGKSMLGTFLRSPVEFSRISSRFGKRKHPISKKWKAHKGVDYAAARGTPIRATADGKVILAGRKGGYGKTVVLRHAGRFSTLYAHMNGFAKGIRSGVRVKQGQTIGYVGSTGMSTGPHLHYEFRVDGVHRNSLTYKTPKASSVSDVNMEKFTKIANEFEQQLDSVKHRYELAKSLQKTDTKKL